MRIHRKDQIILKYLAFNLSNKQKNKKMKNCYKHIKEEKNVNVKELCLLMMKYSIKNQFKCYCVN